MTWFRPRNDYFLINLDISLNKNRHALLVVGLVEAARF
jgi:hypothetical protein